MSKINSSMRILSSWTQNLIVATKNLGKKEARVRKECDDLNGPESGKKDGGADLRKPARPMKYAYTYSAKLAQFPFRFHYNCSWLYHFYPWGVLFTFPLMYKIHKIVNTEENREKQRIFRAKP